MRSPVAGRPTSTRVWSRRWRFDSSLRSLIAERFLCALRSRSSTELPLKRGFPVALVLAHARELLTHGSRVEDRPYVIRELPPQSEAIDPAELEWRTQVSAAQNPADEQIGQLDRVAGDFHLRVRDRLHRRPHLLGILGAFEPTSAGPERRG